MNIPFAKLLLKKGYQVHGLKKEDSSSANSKRIDDSIKTDPHEKDGRFFMHYGVMTDSTKSHEILFKTFGLMKFTTLQLNHMLK